MNNFNQNLQQKVILLKEARRQVLSMHKLLVDLERNNFEKKNGRLTSGQFLNLLVSSSDFQWLRKFSILIVEVDETLDLDDGFSEIMIENHLSEIRHLINLELNDEEFNSNYRKFIQINSEIAIKHSELKKLLG